MTESSTESRESHRKLEKLRNNLSRLSGLVVAFSGGVDSTFLLAVAADVLGDSVTAVTASSELYPEWERQDALNFASELGVNHRILKTSELEVPGFSDNPPDRCYLCKRELFENLRQIADEYSSCAVADGTTADDKSDYRPGRKAAEEKGVISPLLDVDLYKNEIRQLSREMGLPTWNKSSFACLASRFPYGSRITRQKAEQVEKAENYLRENGFSQYRVRHHGDMARIELIPEDIAFLVQNLREEVLNRFKELGFSYVTVDLQGYRTGSMNEQLDN